MAITVVNVTRYQNPDIAVTGTFSLSAPATAGNLLVIAVIGPFADCTWDPYPPGLTSDADGPLRQSGCNLLPVFPLNDPDVFGFFGGSGVSADLWYVVTAGATSISWGSGGNPSFVVYEVNSTTGWPANPLDDVEGAGATSVSVAPITGPALTNTSGGQEIFFQVCAPYSASGSSGNSITVINGGWILDSGGIYVAGNFNNVAGFAYLIGSGSPSAPTFTGGSTHLGYTCVAASFKTASALGTGNILIQKATVPGGLPQSFTFTPSYGAPFQLTDGQSNNSGPLAAGTYSVAETPLATFNTSVSSNPAAIVVTAGQTTTVTFTNTRLSTCAPLAQSGNPVDGVFIQDLSLFIIPSSALYTSLVPFADIRVNESLLQGRNSVILDFNDSEGLYVRDLGTIFTWPMTAHTELYVWQPSIIPLDDDLYPRLSFHFLMKGLETVGWGHIRELNIPFSSTTDLTLLLTFDTGAVPSSISITIPNSGGQESKVKITMPPNKFKLVEGFLSSAQPFLLWENDMECKIKSWGSAEPYRIVKPFFG